MMKAWPTILIVIFMGCSSGRVITYAHAGAEFDEYRTYRIESHQKIAELSPKGYATYQRLDEFIAQELESKGYRYHLEADLLVTYKISSGLSQNNRNNYYDRYSWSYPDYSTRDKRQPVEGSLEVVLLDRHRKKPAWTGSADITFKRRTSDNEEQIKVKIQDIFEQFQYSPPIN